MLYLRLRDAVEKGRTKLIEFSSQKTGMTRYAWRSVRHAPGSAPGEIAKTLAEPDVAEQLESGDVVVVAGRSNLAVSESTALAAVRAVLDAVPGATVLPALRRGNVVGALQLGLAPRGTGNDALSTLRAAADGHLDVLVLLGADPINDCPDADLARRALAGARRIISIDTFMSESTQLADVVLAAAAFGEQTGTTTNLEGRVSRINQKVTAHGTSRPDWMIAADLAVHLGHDLGFASHDDVTDVDRRARACVRRCDAGGRRRFIGGCAGGRIRRASSPRPTVSDAHPSGYDYRLVVSRKLYDRAVQTSLSPSLARLPIGAGAHIHSADLVRVGESEGVEVKLISAKGSVVMPLVADDSVQRGTIWAPFNQAGADITEIVDADAACDRRPGGAVVTVSVRSSRRSAARHRRLVVAGPRDRGGEGARSSSSWGSSAPCSWCGSSARSCRACRTVSGRTRPVRSVCCRRSPTARSCSSRKISAREGRQVGVPPCPVPGVRAGVPGLVGDSRSAATSRTATTAP